VGLLEILLSDLLEKWVMREPSLAAVSFDSALFVINTLADCCLSTHQNTASVDKLEDPINEFIKGEVAAAEVRPFPLFHFSFYS
jgi:hypothetical protein